jgi:predicted DsbA family dithiol-disulfide isomerase
LVVTVYVDGIIVSGSSEHLINEVHQELCDACERSGFTFNLTKSQGPAQSITAFNIFLIANNDMHLTEERLADFIRKMNVSESSVQKNAIVAYVGSINIDQASQLKDLA